jgi:hypothetical protein
MPQQLDETFPQMNSSDPAYTRRVAPLAYRYWEMRGSPLWSSDEDWLRAEREIAHECEPYGPLRFDDRHDFSIIE